MQLTSTMARVNELVFLAEEAYFGSKFGPRSCEKVATISRSILRVVVHPLASTRSSWTRQILLSSLALEGSVCWPFERLGPSNRNRTRS